MAKVSFEIESTFYYSSKECIEYLKGIKGIFEVSIIDTNYYQTLIISYDNSIISYKTIFLEICLFYEKTPENTLLNFDANPEKEYKKYELNLDNIDCDMCYKCVIDELYNTNGIIAIKGCYDEVFNGSRERVRVEIKYDDTIITENKIKALEKEIRSTFC